jgi:hypothetical protein
MKVSKSTNFVPIKRYPEHPAAGLGFGLGLFEPKSLLPLRG